MLVVFHVLDPADLGAEFLCLLSFIVGRLDKAGLAVGFQVQIILQALVSSIGGHFLIPLLVCQLQLPQKWAQCPYIGTVGEDLHAGDILAVDGQLDIIARFQLTVSHVVFLHPHEGGIMVRFGVAIAVISHDSELFFVFSPLLAQMVPFFPCLLLRAFPLALAGDHLKVLRLFGQECFQLGQYLAACLLQCCLLCFLQPLLCVATPDKGVPSGPALQLGPVDEHGLVIHLALLLQILDILVEQILHGLGAPSRAEPGKGRVIRCLPVFEKPHEVYTIFAGLLQLAGGEDAALISICHYLEQNPRIVDRFSSSGRIRFIQFPVIQFLKLRAGHTDGIVLR